MTANYRLSRRSFTFELAALGAVNTLGPLSAKAAAPQADYQVQLDKGVMVAMRDGVQLATDLYWPATDGRRLEGRLPVIMNRTPYGREKTAAREMTADQRKRTRAEVAEYYVRRGYVFIYQDTRGRGDSQGQFVKYLDDGADGHDMCQWIVAQPWSDGRIGMLGTSYDAHTQAAAACAGAPGLKAVFLDFGGFSNAYQSGIRQGGAFELKQVTWAYNLGLESPELAKDPVRLAALKAVDLKAWFASMPWKRGHTPISLLPDYEDYVFDQWRHGVFDGYWKRLGLYAEGYYPQLARTATVHLSGWYDPYSRTATDNYVGVKKEGLQPPRLIMGPWTHGARSTPYAGDVDFGPDATFESATGMDYFAYRLAYFDRTLRGLDTADRAQPPVRLFIMGGGSGRRNPEGRLEHGGYWRSEATWPIARTQLTRFYCHSSGALDPALPAADAPPLLYEFDPKRPVPTIGGAVTSGEPLMRGGAFDQRETATVYGARPPYLPLSARPDVLVFQTEPLKQAVEVTGAIEAVLWISSDCSDTDFTFKLIDVYPPSPDYPEGFDMNLTSGILRCRYRDSWAAPVLMQPGKVYPIKVKALPTANLFQPGHRIRVDISSSNFPHFDVNPNTGAPEGEGLATRVATNTVFADAARPSHIVLPIISQA